MSVPVGVETEVESDNALIRAFKRGDSRAFRVLYTRYKNRAFFYALALTGNRHAAEEVMQEAFLAFLRNVRSFEARTGFRGYLFTAIRTRAIDAERKGRIRREVLQADRLDLFENRAGSDGSGPDGGLEPLVSKALLALPREQREVVLLKVYDDMTFREIAGLTGVSENTAASRYRYACEKLRARLEGSEKWKTGRSAAS